MALSLKQTYHDGFHNIYGLPSVPDGLLVHPQTDEARKDRSRVKWSGKTDAPPAIGSRIKVVMNGIGFGTVLGYFIEAGWLGLHIKPEAPPDWFVRQNKDTKFYKGQALVFGAEVDA